MNPAVHIANVFDALSMAVLAPVVFIIVAVGFIYVLVSALCARKQRDLLAQSGIDKIDEMSGREFEVYLSALFQKLGYQIVLTQYVGDGGADLVLTRDNVRTVVQAKRHKQSVGAKVIGEVMRAKRNYGCSSAIIVTNNRFTGPAVKEARDDGIELWDRNTLLAKHREIGVLPTEPTIHAINPPAAEVQRQALDGTWYAPGGHKTVDQPVLQTVVQSASSCAICGKDVSHKVRSYCLEHRDRFGGRVLCFDHQRGG